MHKPQYKTNFISFFEINDYFACGFDNYMTIMKEELHTSSLFDKALPDTSGGLCFFKKTK
jgi:hypothetical protein